MKPGADKGVEPGCRLRRELADQFATNARLYAEAVVLLTNSTMPTRKFEELCLTVRQAQDRAQAAFMAFEEHVKSHGC
jgi:hypothetical protein